MPNIKKLKTFISDLDGNKFTVSKFSPNQPPVKTEPVAASWVKTAKVEEPAQDLQLKKASSESKNLSTKMNQTSQIYLQFHSQISEYQILF